MNCITCCCTCRNQRKLMKHPCNRSEIFKGNITTQVVVDDLPVYICTMTFEDGSNAGNCYPQQAKHGMCEMYQSR